MDQDKLLVGKNGNAKTIYDHVYFRVLKELEQVFNNPRCEKELREKYPALNFIIAEPIWNCIKAAMSLIHHGKEACFQQALDYNHRWIVEPEDLASELTTCIIETLDKYKTLKIDIEELAKPINLENSTKKFIVFLARSLKSVLITNNQGAKEIIRYIILTDQTMQVMGEREFHSKKKKIKHQIANIISRRECIYFSEASNLYRYQGRQGNKELTDTEIIENMMDRFIYCHFIGGCGTYLSNPELYMIIKEELKNKKIRI